MLAPKGPAATPNDSSSRKEHRSALPTLCALPRQPSYPLSPVAKHPEAVSNKGWTPVMIQR